MAPADLVVTDNFVFGEAHRRRHHQAAASTAPRADISSIHPPRGARKSSPSTSSWAGSTSALIRTRRAQIEVTLVAKAKKATLGGETAILVLASRSFGFSTDYPNGEAEAEEEPDRQGEEAHRQSAGGSDRPLRQQGHGNDGRSRLRSDQAGNSIGLRSERPALPAGRSPAPLRGKGGGSFAVP